MLEETRRRSPIVILLRRVSRRGLVDQLHNRRVPPNNTGELSCWRRLVGEVPSLFFFDESLEEDSSINFTTDESLQTTLLNFLAGGDSSEKSHRYSSSTSLSKRTRRSTSQPTSPSKQHC